MFYFSHFKFFFCIIDHQPIYTSKDISRGIFYLCAQIKTKKKTAQQKFFTHLFRYACGGMRAFILYYNNNKELVIFCCCRFFFNDILMFLLFVKDGYEPTETVYHHHHSHSPHHHNTFKHTHCAVNFYIKLARAVATEKLLLYSRLTTPPSHRSRRLRTHTQNHFCAFRSRNFGGCFAFETVASCGLFLCG